MSAPLSASEQIAHSTVRIEVILNSGESGTGTGFIYKFADNGNQYIPAIVTNKHVVHNSKRGSFHITFSNESGMPSYGDKEIFSFDNFESLWIMHPDPEIDLCVMPIAPLLIKADQDGKSLYYTLLGEDLIPSDSELSDITALEDIVMVGYPNGIWDEKHNMPVFRRGITATHPNLDWNGKSEFLIDAACFPGSSGSPVFLFNLVGYTTKSKGMHIGTGRIKLLGILYAGPQHIVTGDIQIIKVPTIDKPVSVQSIPNNLGMVIKSKNLLVFNEILKNISAN